MLIVTLALSMTFRLPALAEPIDDVARAPGLAILLSHLAGIGTVLSLAAWTQALTTEASRSSLLRAQIIAASVTAAVMIAMFLSLPPRTSDEFLDGTAGQPQAAIYYLAFALFLATSMTLSSHTLWGLRRRSERSLTRTGLTVLAYGTSLGVVNLLGRTTFLILQAGAEPRRGSPAAISLDAVGLLGMTLILAGCSIPAADAMTGRLRSIHTLWTIRPMWRDLVATHPEVVLPLAPTGLLKTGSHPQLLRYAIECRDVMIQLRAYVHAHDVDGARLELRSRGLTGQQLDAATEAAWLRIAVARLANDASPGPTAGFPAQGGHSMAQDIAWLKMVASAYRRPDVLATATALAHLSQPIPQPRDPVTSTTLLDE